MGAAKRFAMIEILAILGLLVGLAKKTPKRRRYNLRRVRTTSELALATLASDTALFTGLTGTSTSSYRCVSVAVAYAIQGLTAGEGPITVGLAHSDYTVTEIKECMESFAAIDVGLKIEQERANRLIRVVGVLDSVQNRLNDGKLVKTRLNWAIGIGKQVNLFVFNESGATLTTGAVATVTGNLYIKDSS